MENIGKVKDELNQILVNLIEETVKVSDKYGLNRNVVARQMGEKIYLATNMSDFTTYQCKENENIAEYEEIVNGLINEQNAWNIIYDKVVGLEQRYAESGQVEDVNQCIKLENLLNYFKEELQSKEESAKVHVVDDLAVVEALSSIYPLQPFEEEAIHRVVASANGANGNDFCEWKDGVIGIFHIKTCCGHSIDVNYGYDYCPYCGKKIKVVE